MRWSLDMTQTDFVSPIIETLVGNSTMGSRGGLQEGVLKRDNH